MKSKRHCDWCFATPEEMGDRWHEIVWFKGSVNPVVCADNEECGFGIFGLLESISPSEWIKRVKDRQSTTRKSKPFS